MTAVIELRGVAKAFGACVANRDISFAVRTGSIHAIVGENGAGKSTAMKMLYGMFRPDSGEILLDGKAVRFRSPRDASRAGLGMVHQHFMLAGPHSGLDNIVLGPGAPRRRAALAELTALAAAYNFPIDFTKPVETLPIGVQQRLEIVKLLYRKARILILDEPTAVLTPQESDELFVNLRRLRDEGRTILIITHKLKEVMRLADEVTVFRQGKVVAGRVVAETSEAELAALMVGRSVRLTADLPPPPNLGAPALTVDGLTLARKGEKPLLDGLTLTVRAGEVVGIAGIEGNGQSDLLAVLAHTRTHFRRAFGAAGVPQARGRLEILGTDARDLSARAARNLGFGLIPEDRQRQGLILGFDLVRNFVLGLQREPAFGTFGMIKWGAVRRRFAAAAEAFDIRPRASGTLARNLSGGNQQKIVIARELERQPKLLVCAQPTRGVDVGSIEFIHERILEARNGGAGVLLISSSLEEVMALSDRILVLYEGKITGEFARGATDEPTLGRYMGGAHA